MGDMRASQWTAICTIAILAATASDGLGKATKKKPAPAPQTFQTFQTAPPPMMLFGNAAFADLYPDHGLTPGLADTYSVQDIQARYRCPSRSKAGKDGKCTYSAAHRSVSTATKNEV